MIFEAKSPIPPPKELKKEGISAKFTIWWFIKSQIINHRLLPRFARLASGRLVRIKQGGRRTGAVGLAVISFAI